MPHLKERLDALVFRSRFQGEADELMPDLAILRGGAMEMMESKRLKAVLRMVLMLGNALNAGTFRGAAKGFKMDALLKVR